MTAIYIFVPFYVDALGVESYGIIAFYSILLTIGSLADIGLSTTFSREAAREPDRERIFNLLATIERILLSAVCIFALIVCVGANFIAEHWLNNGTTLTVNEIANSLRLMALTIVPQIGLSLYSAGLLGLQRQGTANMLQAAYSTARGGLVIPLIYYMPSIQIFFVWQLAVSIIFLLIFRSLLIKSIGYKYFMLGQYNYASLKPILKFAGSVLALTILGTVITQIDKILVSKMFSMSDFGYYNLAAMLGQVSYAAITPLMIAFFPRITELVSGNKLVDANRLFADFTFIVAALSAVISFSLILFSQEILQLWLGVDRAPEKIVSVVRILSIGGLFMSLTAAPFYLGLANGHNRTSTINAALTLVFVIPLMAYGASVWGLIGIAVSSILASVTSFIALSLFVVRRFYGGSTRAWFLRSVVTPIAAAAATIFAARLIVDWVEPGALLSCAIAGVMGGLLLMLSCVPIVRRL